MRYVWLIGAALGMVAGGVVISDVPLLVKLLVGLAVVAVGIAGPFGSVLLAGLLLGAGVVTFVILLLTSEAGDVGSSLGVATMLIASGLAFSIRELFRDRGGSTSVGPTVSPDAQTDDKVGT